MEHKGYIEELENLLRSEDLLEVSNEVSDLRSRFDDYILEEERKLQVAELEATDEGVSIPEPEGDFGKEAFYALYAEYKKKRKALLDEKNAIEENNFQEKKALIRRLQEIITTEENIGSAFSAFKDIQEKWKTTGDVPRSKRNDIQSDYSRAIEDFFYTINIYKEIKDHDLHRNKQLKEEIIGRLKTLRSEQSMKELEHQLKIIQNDWEDIGPVPNDEWEALKGAYWTEVRSIYERINRFYEDRRAEQKENIEKKRELINEAAEIVEGMNEFETVKQWEKATSKILRIQEKWKTIGFGPRKENNETWKAFRKKCDEFFDAKKAFFNDIQGEFDQVAEKKRELIGQANELSNSTDWQETAKKLIHLQKRWKELGTAGRKHEQKLWKQFRAACDAFFTARQKHFEDEEKEYRNNLEQKQALITKIEAYSLPENKQDALAALKQFASDFSAIGHVPREEKDKVFKAFRSAIDTHYKNLKLETKEKESILFEAKVNTLASSPDSGREFDKLRSDLRREIDQLKREIIQMETNLGFFANSKGADKLRSEVQKKIDAANSRIEDVKTKLKMIPR